MVSTHALTPRTAVVTELEKVWNSSSDAAVSPDLRIDLSAVGYIDVPGMVFLLSRIVQRTRLGWRTVIDLPANSKVIQTLRAWRFDEAVERICGVPFDLILDQSSASRWFQYADQPRTAQDELLPQHYYPIQAVLRASREFNAKLASDWSESWREQYILSVLNKLLSGPDDLSKGKQIGTHIIHEAVMNGIRHPGARVVLTAASTRHYASTSSDYLTICVWDDGESIASTLRGLAGRYRHLVPRENSLHRRGILLERVGVDGKPQPKTRIDNQTPVPTSADDGSLLLASTFPGVTSDLEARRGYAHPDLVRADPDFGLPGMGLFVLSTTVAEVFGGKLTIRSGALRLSIDKPARESPAGDATLRAKITELPAHSELLGNQLTIRIPRRGLTAKR